MTAHRYYLLEITSYKSGPALAAVVAKFGKFKKPLPPGAGPDAVPEDITPQTGTLKDQLEAGRRAGILRAGPPAFYNWDEKVAPIRTSEETATHVLIPINNHPATMDTEVAGRAQGKGKPYNKVSLAPDDARKFNMEGALPPY